MRAILLEDEERFRLVRGPYEPPLFKGGFLVDAVRGGKRKSLQIPAVRAD